MLGPAPARRARLMARASGDEASGITNVENDVKSIVIAETKNDPEEKEKAAEREVDWEATPRRVTFVYAGTEKNLNATYWGKKSK